MILNNCRGDVFKHGDNNRGTDNQRGTADDRLIQTKPVPAIGQFNFITVQALTAQLAQSPPRPGLRQDLPGGRQAHPGLLPARAGRQGGAAVIACLELYRASGEAQYREGAVAYGQRVLALQVTNAMAGEAPVRGFLRRSLQSAEPERQISNGCLHLFGLCALLETLPEYPQAPRLGQYWYRYFMPPEASWVAIPLVPARWCGWDPTTNRLDPTTPLTPGAVMVGKPVILESDDRR